MVTRRKQGKLKSIWGRRGDNGIDLQAWGSRVGMLGERAVGGVEHDRERESAAGVDVRWIEKSTGGTVPRGGSLMVFCRLASREAYEGFLICRLVTGKYVARRSPVSDDTRTRETYSRI